MQKRKTIAQEIYVTKIALLEATFKKETFKEQLSLE